MLLTPLEVFYDDSGNRGDAPVFLWAGYLASQAAWKRIGREWNVILDGPPSLPYWHTSNARAAVAPFVGHPHDQVLEREMVLASLLAENADALIGFVLRIPREYWRELVEGKIAFAKALPKSERRALGSSSLENLHLIALQWGVVAALVLSERMKFGMHTNFIYEGKGDAAYEEAAKGSIESLRVALPLERSKRVGTLSFRDGKTRANPELQAADLLAWHCGKRAERKQRPKADADIWRVLSRTTINEFTINATQLGDYVDRWNSGEQPVPRLA